MQADQSSQTERERLCLRNELANMHYCDAFLIKSSALMTVPNMFVEFLRSLFSCTTPLLPHQCILNFRCTIRAFSVLGSYIPYDKSYQQLVLMFVGSNLLNKQN